MTSNIWFHIPFPYCKYHRRQFKRHAYAFLSLHAAEIAAIRGKPVKLCVCAYYRKNGRSTGTRDTYPLSLISSALRSVGVHVVDAAYTASGHTGCRGFVLVGLEVGDDA